MTKVKRILALLLALAMLFTLTACSSKKKTYQEANTLFDEGDYQGAMDLYESLGDYEDCQDQIVLCKKNIKYEKATALFEEKEYADAFDLFDSLGTFKDSDDMAKICKIRKDPVSALMSYVTKNGEETETGRYKLTRDSGIDGVELSFAVGDGTFTGYVTCTVILGTVTVTYTTVMDVVGDPGGAMVQSNSMSTGNNSISSIATGNVDISSFTTETRPTITNFVSSVSSASVTESFVDTSVDGMNFILEELAQLLKEIDSELTLKDLGFTSYKIDSSRHSGIREDGTPGL